MTKRPSRKTDIETVKDYKANKRLLERKRVRQSLRVS